MIDAREEFRKCLNDIEDPREKVLFGKGFIKGFEVACESAKENVAEAFEHLKKGTASEYTAKLREEVDEE